ncbi:glycosyltransferase [Pedobacter aquae]|uniref:Glycosyltransferase n=1 Tax=Pedobacter aquae TaxID=2605747 RepID=A0A5C0VC42_9SPHI|nr:glycosyltransferase family 2 protein [Pedobacter aquae]QEK50328.1 glycosyltransferase [Pedobacter aquae]
MCRLYPKISIITPSFNQGKFIEETILSVLNQGYPNLEYIIIDGGSTDETVEIIKKYENKLAYWISEKDNGQTHAINKGLRKATGDIFAYLNSDDCYYPNTLKLIAEAYLANNDNDDLLLIGHCYWAKDFNDENGQLDKPRFPMTLKDALLNTGLAPQPSMFWTMKKNQLSFCDSLTFCMDYEFWLQLIINKYKIIHIDRCLSLFRQHEQTKTKTIKHILAMELIGLNYIYRKFLSKEEQKTVVDYNKKQICRANYFSLSIEMKKVSLLKRISIILRAELGLIMKLKLLTKSIYAKN